jgi:uncharacterized lipoprotein YddW (UPF0748 family)
MAGLALKPGTTAQETAPEEEPERERFEVAAWIDHFDFARVYDTEKIEGLEKLLDHVQETGATTIWWRPHSGGRVRYRSEVDAGYHNNSTIDKRITFDSQEVYGWVRYGETDFDILEEAMKLGKKRGLKVGVHWPFEETHWAVQNLGDFNVEHPEYWGRGRNGSLRMINCSLGYEEVVQHKLALLDEMIERGIEVLYIDFMRSSHNPAYEYVEPVTDAFKGGDWNAHVEGYITNYLRQVRQRLDASGRKIELIAGFPNLHPNQKHVWQRWVDEGLVDTLNVISMNWDAGDAFGSTRALGTAFVNTTAGRCRVLLPIRQYKHYTRGFWHYEKATGNNQAEIARELIGIAHDVGAHGVALECVDYNNYGPETRKALKEAAEGPCRYRVER